MSRRRQIVFWLICIFYISPIWALPDAYTEESFINYEQDQLHTYTHLATGMQWIWIENKDANMSFSLGVKTPTHDNTGVNHIIEHTVFTGSEKYPSATLFFDASSAYPHTFMNAMTSSDCTMYPFSTPYKQSFENLLDIYLESIFHPQMLNQKNSFYEEAFHYNPYTKQYGGVVYNEMKGANGDINRTLFRAIRSSLYEGTHYSNDSGGEVESIPYLTYEEFIMTYHAYYYPGNMIGILYGDLDIDKVLNQVDSFIKDYPKREGKVNVCTKPNLSSKEQMIETDQLKNRGMLVRNFLLAQNPTPENEFMLDTWVNTYLLNEQSEFIKGLREIGVPFVDVQKDADTKYPIYSIILQELPLSKINTAQAQLDKLLMQIKENQNINRQLEGDSIAKNKLEIHRADTIANRGILISQSMIEAWTHEKPLDQYFRVKEYSNKMKEIDHQMVYRLLEAAHSNDLIFKPIQKTTQETPLIPEGEWEQIVQGMDRWQKNQVASKLPAISLPEMLIKPQLKYKVKKRGFNYILTEIETDLIQTNLYIPSAHIEQNRLPYLSLYTYMLQEAAKDLSPFTASFASKNITSYEKEGYIPYVAMRIVSTDTNKTGYEIFEEASKVLREKEEDWYKNKLGQWIEIMKQTGASNLLETLAVLNKAGMEGGKRYEYEMFFPIYRIKEELQSKSNPWIQEIKKISDEMSLNNQCYIAISGNKENVKQQYKSWRKYYSNVQSAQKQYGSYVWEALPKNRMYSFDGEVDYLMYSYDLGSERLKGVDYVVASFITKNYLQPKIRIQKGAYGSGLSAVFPNTISLYTYRDPDYVSSLQDIRAMPKQLKDLITKETLESAKANALSKFQNQMALLESPFSQLEVFQRILLMDESPSILFNLQKEILNTTEKDLEDAFSQLEERIQKSSLGICTSKKALN